MRLMDLMKQKKAPCSKCPYKLGAVTTTVNPCPQCERNGYDAYERFLKLPLQGKYPKDSKE